MISISIKQVVVIALASLSFGVSTLAPAQTQIDDWARTVQGSKSSEDFLAAMAYIDQAIAATPMDVKLYNTKMRLHSWVSYPRELMEVVETGEAGIKRKLPIDDSFLFSAYLELGDYGKARQQLQSLEQSSKSKHTPVAALADYIRAVYQDPSFAVELQKLENQVNELAKVKSTAPTRAAAVSSMLWVGVDIPVRKYYNQVKEDSTISGYTKRVFANRVMIPQGDYAGALEWLGHAVSGGDNKAQWELARLLVLKGDFIMAEPLLQKANTELQEASLLLRSVHEYPVRAALARTLGHKGEVAGVKQLYISSPAITSEEESTIWYLQTILWPRLQIAVASKDKALIKEASEHLYRSLSQRRTKTGGRNDVEPALLLDLLAGLQDSGHSEIAKALAADTLQKVADARLPYHKAARGQAYAILGEDDKAKQAYAEASTLAPTDVWIRKALESISAP